jgi:hypothetical protein
MTSVPSSIRPGDVLAGRYTLIDLLSESRGGLFWYAHDRVLARHVALHVIPASDERAPLLLAAAKRSAKVVDPRILRVLDANEIDGRCYVVNEWGAGQSLDNMLDDGPLSPRRAAWIVSEVAATIARAHDAGVTHDRLVPENVMVDRNGSVKIIGFAVDAALHGLPEGRRTTDVVDLAALLYAALVGKWPGVSRSRLPEAPMENGHPLRPRKVRAGIPKPLDIVCEQVLTPYPMQAVGISSAADIQAALTAFVGDPGELANGGDTGPLPAVSLDATQEVAPVPDLPAQEPGAPEPPAPGLSAPSGPQAGMDATQAMVPPTDADWRAPREDAPPPPPALDQPAPKPLFADDDTRRPRSTPEPTADAGATPEFWPWDGAAAASTDTAERDYEEPVPGRSWLRLAAFLAAAVLLFLAAVFAFNAGRDQRDSGSGGKPGDNSSRSSTVLAPVGARDFDPEGDPPTEYPELVKNVLDGDPATTWHTSTYDQQFGPEGLKAGVGIILDLGESKEVGSVDVSVVGAPTSAQLFVLDRRPSTVDGLTPAAAGTASTDQLTLTPDAPVTGRFVLVWLTALPHPAGYRGEISEIVVRS